MKHRRNNFTNETKREAYARSGGVCECHLMPEIFPVPCGRPLGEGNTWYEHIDPDRISGRNDIENCAALTKTCGRFKSANYDAPTIARVRKREDRSRGIRREPSLPGSRKDPFKLPLKQSRRMPVDRTTGQPWRGW